MRFRVDVAASVPQMAWEDVHGPARAVVYELIGGQNPDLAAGLHDSGWQGSPLRPVGVCPPVFLRAPRKRGCYATSPQGMVRLGSPVPQIAATLLAALGGRSELRWGPVPLRVRGVQLEPAPDHSAGVALLESVSPVVVKRDDRFLVPGDAGYEDRLVHNLRHKADVLGLPNEVEVEVVASGPRRRFDTAKGFRIGAQATVRVAAAPQLLDAIYDWGLGLATNQGFGWVK
ncbi:CRISPR-associated endoribonuclease Cas6 [Streptomonospora sp. S1-112]|uniref:CRISPR-associated endoribonuclease Cas6 n=1 Tax=Streptomonospora mangrovi TaxID=2883123 RepID=A0A9X3SFT7_9ACTN|nr:CRISPR-associated endoribonuclease Cas6 [Streptomonospora mangrovi]MDA0565215.1 CRISPR-associated endoribonuclease Cas6 [Streptomonospora mangrovi]